MSALRKAIGNCTEQQVGNVLCQTVRELRLGEICQWLKGAS
jgi:hypothetical protein